MYILHSLRVLCELVDTASEMVKDLIKEGSDL
jgi:hypothetical protein